MYRFKHMGKLGDIIFSLPTIKAMGGGILYLPEQTEESPALFSQLKPLLEQQDYITEVREYPSMLGYGEKVSLIPIDVDLDKHREHMLRGKVNMVQRYFDVFNVRGVDYRQPWLTIQGPRLLDHKYNLINLTERFRDNSTVNWKKVLDKIEKPVYFIGTKQEHEEFVEKIGYILRLDTPDFLTFALYIRDCTALYANQSAALSLACAINKTRHIEFKRGKTNCKFYTNTEFEIL